MVNESMIEFRLEGTAEPVLMRLSQIMCLMPARRHVRTVEHGWTLTVCEEDWDRVEKAFRGAYFGGQIKAQ